MIFTSFCHYEHIDALELLSFIYHTTKRDEFMDVVSDPAMLAQKWRAMLACQYMNMIIQEEQK